MTAQLQRLIAVPISMIQRHTISFEKPPICHMPLSWLCLWWGWLLYRCCWPSTCAPTKCMQLKLWRSRPSCSKMPQIELWANTMYFLETNPIRFLLLYTTRFRRRERSILSWITSMGESCISTSTATRSFLNVPYTATIPVNSFVQIRVKLATFFCLCYALPLPPCILFCGWRWNWQRVVASTK